MKKIGFIDYFIDEWHANNYPKFFGEASLKDRFAVTLAWEEVPKPGGRPLAKWCEEMHITPAASLEQVVAECDALCVLAPSNPELHERLAELPLRSGKPVYVDKPFAPDRGAAERLFALAAKHNTPLMSASALRYGTELQQALAGKYAQNRPLFAGARGGGRSFEEYAIHQVEMITALLGCGASRVMQTGNSLVNHMVIEYPDERRASMTLMPGQDFQVSAANREGALVINQHSSFFPNLIEAILKFFDTGVSPIAPAETIEIAAVVAAGVRALKTPGKWVKV